MSTSGLVEHFFRHEYGRLVVSLSRRVGGQRIEAIEANIYKRLGRRATLDMAPTPAVEALLRRRLSVPAHLKNPRERISGEAAF